jgi:DNA-binding NarL/FixJ family response regulator
MALGPRITLVVAGEPPPIAASHLTADPVLMVVWSAASGHELFLQCTKLAPCVLIAHESLLTSAEWAEGPPHAEFGPPVAMIMVSDCDGEALYKLFVRFRFSGLVRPGASPPVVHNAIRAVAEGELWLPRKMLSRAIREWSPPLAPDRLTPREEEVLRLIRDGLNNREISEAAGIGRETVRWYVRRLNAKVGSHARSSKPTHEMK